MSEPKKKYNSERDRERMKLWMRDERAKDKAGFGHLTVTQYRNALAAMQMESIEALK